MRRFSEHTWLASLVVHATYFSALDLQRITDEARRGLLAVEPSTRLLNMNNLRNILTEHTEFVSVKRIDKHTLNLQFSAVITAPNTPVYRMFGFNHVDNLEEIQTDR